MRKPTSRLIDLLLREKGSPPQEVPVGIHFDATDKEIPFVPILISHPSEDPLHDDEEEEKEDLWSDALKNLISQTLVFIAHKRQLPLNTVKKHLELYLDCRNRPNRQNFAKNKEGYTLYRDVLILIRKNLKEGDIFD